MKATVHNMRPHAGTPGLVAWSPLTGEQCSADWRDYFWLDEDSPLVDSEGEPMILARAAITVTPI